MVQRTKKVIPIIQQRVGETTCGECYFHHVKNDTDLCYANPPMPLVNADGELTEVVRGLPVEPEWFSCTHFKPKTPTLQ